MKLRTELSRAIIGSPIKLKVIEFLLIDGRPISENGLAERIGFSQPAVSKTVKELKELNLIDNTKVGNANVWSLNQKSYAYPTIKSLEVFFRSPKTPLDYLMADLRRQFFEISYHVKEAYIAGSVARGFEGKKSDIDVVVVISNEYAKLSLETIITKLNEGFHEKFGMHLSATIVTEAEAKNIAWIREKQDFIRL